MLNIPLLNVVAKIIFSIEGSKWAVIYAESILLILGGAFSMANLKAGWFLVALSMIILIVTRDNPLLETSGLGSRHCF